jgi:hypothetical protein
MDDLDPVVQSAFKGKDQCLARKWGMGLIQQGMIAILYIIRLL